MSTRTDDRRADRTPQSADAQETRKRILDEARGLFRTYGYAKTTVADIAQACGMSPANVYRFFASKAAINDTICRFTWGDRVGVGDFEISNNAGAGATEPVCAINGVLADGLHRRGDR